MPNFFTQILETVKAGLSRSAKGSSAAGFDISSTAIKAVQLRKERGRAILETYGEVFLGPYAGLSAGQAVNLPPDKLVEAIRDLVVGAKITTQKIGLAVPLRSSLISLIELPAVSEKQLNEMVPIEARKYIPVPISEVMLDWWIIPRREFPPSATVNPEQAPVVSPGPAKAEVLMVAIHQSSLLQYKDILGKANLVADAFEIESFSAIRAVLGRDMLPTMIIDMGAVSTKISIVDFGVIRVSHVVARGAQDITFALSKALSVNFDEAERMKRELGITGQVAGQNISGVAGSVAEYIFFEANKVLASYQRKYNRAVSRAVLIGGGALLKGLDTVIAKSLEIPATMGEPFAKVEAPAMFDSVLAGAGPEFAVALGVALREVQA